MSHKLINDEQIFRKFWLDEKNTPQHFQDGTNSWRTTWEDFEGFCAQSWRIYLIDDIALIYVEKLGRSAQIHFSLLRGNDAFALIDDFIAIRNEVFKEVELIFGWVGRHNRGLKRIVEAVGFRHFGFTMLSGESHGKVLEWKCYSTARAERFTIKNSKSLLVSI